MSMPGADRLAAIHPAFAAEAERLGRAAWFGTARTPRQTAAAFLGCDLALGLTGLPLDLHLTMARALGLGDVFLRDLIVQLAPSVGFPIAAQALIALNPQDDGTTDEATAGEVELARSAAAAVLGRGAVAARVADIVAEYGTARF